MKKEWPSQRPREEEIRDPGEQQDRPQGAARRISSQARKEIEGHPSPDPRRVAARERIQQLDHQHRHATACERAGMSLVAYYRSWWGWAA